MVPVKVPVPQMQLVPGPQVGTAAVALDWGTAVVNVPVLAPGVAVGVASSAPSYMMGAGGGGEGGGGHEGGEGKPPVPETPPSEGAPTPSSPEGAAGPSPPAPPAPPAAAPPAEAAPAAKSRPPRPGAQFSNNLRNWAQRHGLDLRSETTAEILNNLDITVQEFKARFRSGWTEFTTDQLKMTVREAINSGESRLRKLLINQREKFTGGKGKGRR
jgi:pyruvate/2-oxoglutarate dehydrogenase complex dihydrolipoamide acyltransferase (E2) component